MKSEKITYGAPGRRRWYADACGAAFGLELVGERWSLLVMRELMFGPRRFGELRAHLTGISANVLTQRLEGLEEAGIVRRERLPSPANVQVYALTEWGAEAEPIFQALGRWATRSPHHDRTLPFSPASAMLSLRTMIDEGKVWAFDATVAFQFPDDRFVARLRGGQLLIERNSVHAADISFVTDPGTLASVIHGKRPFRDAEAAGGFRVEGDRALAQRFADLFALPAIID